MFEILAKEIKIRLQAISFGKRATVKEDEI